MMHKIINKLSHYPVMLLVALLASLFSLIFALVSEYGFHLKPCHLCILQRIPYVVAALLALLGLWKRGWARPLLILIALSFLVDSGIAFYHTGVEQKWFPGPEGCTDQGGAETLTVEQILEKLRNAPIVSCDQPQWDLSGITMAAMNAMWAFALFVLTVVALQQNRKKAPEHA